MQGHLSDASCKLGVVGDSHTTFASGNRFVRIEGKASDCRCFFSSFPPALGMFTPVSCGECVGGIFYNPQAMPASKLGNFVHIHHESCHMDRYDSHDLCSPVQGQSAFSKLADLILSVV
jgi:hypothetical protein